MDLIAKGLSINSIYVNSIHFVTIIVKQMQKFF